MLSNSSHTPIFNTVKAPPTEPTTAIAPSTHLVRKPYFYSPPYYNSCVSCCPHEAPLSDIDRCYSVRHNIQMVRLDIDWSTLCSWHSPPEWHIGMKICWRTNSHDYREGGRDEGGGREGGDNDVCLVSITYMYMHVSYMYLVAPFALRGKGLANVL